MAKVPNISIPDTPKKVSYYEMEMDTTPEEEEILIEYALTHIVNDPEALIEYAVTRMLEGKIEALVETNEVLRRLLAKAGVDTGSEKPKGKKNAVRQSTRRKVPSKKS